MEKRDAPNQAPVGVLLLTLFVSACGGIDVGQQNTPDGPIPLEPDSAMPVDSNVPARDTGPSTLDAGPDTSDSGTPATFVDAFVPDADTRMCSVFGVIYGDSANGLPSPDGCNTCQCEDGTVTACTERGCGPQPIAQCAVELPAWDPFQLDDLRADGNVLSAQVSYGGGCALHYFSMCYEPVIGGSQPPLIQLRMVHDSQGDPCLAFGTQTIRFDLSSLDPFLDVNLPVGQYRVTVNGEGSALYIRN